MRIAQYLLVAALSTAALAVPPALAAATPPRNDNYLASLPVDRAEFTAVADTTDATTQPDTFNPSADGQPLGGGPPGPTTCNGVSCGNTVWYDLAPQFDGAADISATGVFPVAVALYEWSDA